MLVVMTKLRRILFAALQNIRVAIRVGGARELCPQFFKNWNKERRHVDSKIATFKKFRLFSPQKICFDQAIEVEPPSR